MSCLLAHAEHLFDSPLCIGSAQVVPINEEPHDFVQFRFGLHDQVFKPDEEYRQSTLSSFRNHKHHPAVDMMGDVLDPPVPIVRVELLDVEGVLE